MAASAMLPALSTSAQSTPNERFTIKATADIGLSSSLSTGTSLPEASAKASSSDFGFDFGMIVWQHSKSSLELNAGLSYGSTSIKADLPKFDYHYSAPSTADMDGDTYIRYYELKDLHQKISVGRFAVPVYVNYRYRIHRLITVHALAGFKFGFNVSSKLTSLTGKAYSYGIYPQYDDLMIDASYMNMFGDTSLDSAQGFKPKTSSFSFSIIAGLGAEIYLWGPLSADVSLRFEQATGNMFKALNPGNASYGENDAIVTYTVAEGQKVKAIPNFFDKSKLSRLSLALSLIYRF